MAEDGTVTERVIGEVPPERAMRYVAVHLTLGVSILAHPGLVIYFGVWDPTHAVVHFNLLIFLFG